MDRAVAGLDRDGIALLERTLPASTCAALEAFAGATPALPFGREARDPDGVRDARNDLRR